MKLPEASAGSFEICPDGTHLAVCVAVIDLGTQYTEFKGEAKRKHQIFIKWEIPGELREMDDMPHTIGQFYTLSMNEKANLRRDLEAWRGAQFTDAQLGPDGSFEMQNLIGKSCYLGTLQEKKGDSTYANIKSIAALPKGIDPQDPVGETTFLSLDPDEFDKDVFDGLSNYMQNKIMDSPEYRIATGQPQRVNVAGEIDHEAPF